jgi:cytochrome b
MKRDIQAGLQVVLGALAGAIAHTIQAAVVYPGSSHLLSAAALPFMLYIALWALAPAIVTILLLRLAARWGWRASAIASVTAFAASYPFFVWYMRQVSPLVAWERAWLLPLTAAAVTILLFWLDWPRAGRAET